MLSKALQTQAVEHLKCMTHRAQDLRISCEGSSVGFVTPTTWQQCVFTAESTHDAYTDAEDDGVPCAVLHVVPCHELTWRCGRAQKEGPDVVSYPSRDLYMDLQT